MPFFANTGKNDAISAYADTPQVIEFAAGNNVKTAPHLSQMIQNG